MSAARFTLRHDDRPAVELQDTAAGILVTTFGWPRTLTSEEAVRLHAALGVLISERTERTADRTKRGASA